MVDGIGPIDPNEITDPPKQGAESNLSGQFLENAIEREFSARGVIAYPFSRRGYNNDLFQQHFLLKNVPYKSIYGCRSHSEFVYRHPATRIDIRIECRFQQSPGSVDEKMPYLLMNAREAMPEQEIWLIIDGGGARKHALEWIQKQAKRTDNKVIQVFDLMAARRAIKQLLNRVRAA